MSHARRTIERYLDRHAVAPPPWIELPPPDDELRICVVIPAYDELDTIEDVVRSLLESGDGSVPLSAVSTQKRPPSPHIDGAVEFGDGSVPLSAVSTQKRPPSPHLDGAVEPGDGSVPLSAVSTQKRPPSPHIDETSPRAVEVLVCVNNPDDAPPDVVEANRETIDRLRSLDSPFPLHVLDRATEGRAFPSDRAGVGQARRLLMDLATKRLHRAGRCADGLIACLDGDSPADPGYLDAIWRELDAAPPRALAGVCHYRHPIPDDPAHARAIIAYETWMRYFEAALHLTNTPYAFQSIGSCMVLSARGYARADGVPPREALSDFYLLQKVAKTGGRGSVIQLDDPLVRPSARPSTRVPRGTGPSVRASMHHGEDRFIFVEPPSAFFDLRRFFSAIRPAFAEPDALRQAASPFLSEILDRWSAWRTIDKLRTHAPDPARFERQFHTWFDSLKIVKYANRCREHRGAVFLFDAVRELMADPNAPPIADAIPHVSPDEAELDDWHRLLAVLRPPRQ